MRIRHLEDEADVRDATRVNVQAWRAAYDGVLSDPVLEDRDPDPSDERVREIYGAWREDREGILVADEAGTVRGYAYFRWSEGTKPFVGDDEAGLKELYVHPDHWGRGIGTRLLERGIEVLPGDARRLRLETLTDNERARRFYEARGFERTGTTGVEIAGATYPAIVYAREL